MQLAHVRVVQRLQHVLRVGHGAAGAAGAAAGRRRQRLVLLLDQLGRRGGHAALGGTGRAVLRLTVGRGHSDRRRAGRRGRLEQRRRFGDEHGRRLGERDQRIGHVRGGGGAVGRVRRGATARALQLHPLQQLGRVLQLGRQRRRGRRGGRFGHLVDHVLRRGRRRLHQPRRARGRLERRRGGLLQRRGRVLLLLLLLLGRRGLWKTERINFPFSHGHERRAPGTVVGISRRRVRRTHCESRTIPYVLYRSARLEKTNGAAVRAFKNLKNSSRQHAPPSNTVPF